MNKESQQLIADYMAGKAVEDELLAACREDPEVLQALAELTAVDHLLQLEAGDSGADVFAAEVRARLEAEADASFSHEVRARIEGKKRNRWIAYFAYAAAACVALSIVLFYQMRAGPYLAELTATRDANWGNAELENGESLKKGRVLLTHGYSEITMNSGVTLVLEAPVEIQIESQDLIRLVHGKLVAKVPEVAIGFTVLTPTSEVVDLGTEFAMSVDVGGASEVHVLDGEVKARSLKGKKFTHLLKDEGMAFEDQYLEARIRSQPENYLRALPGRSSEDPDYLHWSFDGGGEELISAGKGMNGQFAKGWLKSLNAGEGPVYQNGQYGQALYFNGQDAYVETDFSGIGGSAPRTVAFWVKVPEDFNIHNGYGILGWGRMSKGAAWQISPNPAAEDGPLGRIRIGTYEAPVIGTTDLRDNRWHHVAVVMYGGDSVNAATHILLYVDGQLEPTSIKSITSIDTELDHASSLPMMIGRNLGFRHDSSKNQNRFFKGWLDEIYVVDAALDQKQIQNLMQNNRFN